MEFIQSDIEGVCLIKPDVFNDQRGFFLETFNQSKYEAALPYHFVQDNMSFSQRGVVRGLHYQLKQPQGKLVFVLGGEILDVAVDIRRRSPTFGHWVSYNLSEQNKHQLFIPPGFAHGFMVLSKSAQVYYKCTDLYCHGDEYGLLWSDPELAISWPATEALLSPKDSILPTLKTVDREDLPL